MQTVIYCVRAAGGKHEFYMMADRERYYLFTQDYRKGVQNYFGKGLMLNEAMDYSRSNRNRAVVHTMDKIPVYIRYVEKEYGVTVLKRTKRFTQNGRGYLREYEECDFQEAV